MEPAHTTSPLGSTARHVSCADSLPTNVRKLRYRTRSNALSVVKIPSASVRVVGLRG
jgi:hypothetical protein